jgi:hypothetical protein
MRQVAKARIKGLALAKKQIIYHAHQPHAREKRVMVKDHDANDTVVTIHVFRLHGPSLAAIWSEVGGEWLQHRNDSSSSSSSSTPEHQASTAGF